MLAINPSITQDSIALQVDLHTIEAMETLSGSDTLGTSSDNRVLALAQIGVLCRIATALEKIAEK